MNKLDKALNLVLKASLVVQEIIGDFDIPKEENNNLIHGDNSLHVTWEQTPLSTQQSYMFLKICKLIEDRGGVRGKDYILTAYEDMYDNKIKMAIHTTTNFLSSEDYSK